MHQFEGHHVASPYAPYFLVGREQWIHSGDPAEVVGPSTEEKVVFPVRAQEFGGHRDKKIASELLQARPLVRGRHGGVEKRGGWKTS